MGGLLLSNVKCRNVLAFFLFLSEAECGCLNSFCFGRLPSARRGVRLRRTFYFHPSTSPTPAPWTLISLWASLLLLQEVQSGPSFSCVTRCSQSQPFLETAPPHVVSFLQPTEEGRRWTSRCCSSFVLPSHVSRALQPRAPTAPCRQA